MAKKKGRHRKGGRTTPKGTRPLGSGRAPGPGTAFGDGRDGRYPPYLTPVPGVGPFGDPFDDSFDDPDEPDLMVNLAAALASGEPLDLLTEVSALLAAFDWAREDPFTRPDGDGGGDEDDQPTLADLVRLFGEVDRRESTAFLALAAELAKEDWVRSRALQAGHRRHHQLPEWIGTLAEASVDRCVEQVHVLGDGDNIMLGVSLPTGHRLVVVVYIDHNLGTVVKDAFVVPGTIDELVTLMREQMDVDPDIEWRDLDPADARRHVDDANEHADITWPPYETETWPACRPIVEWAMRRLPDGGRPYERHEWTDAERDALAADVLASPFAAGFNEDDDPELLDHLLWYGTDYGPGDPLRWSAVGVELVLADWLPRKIVAPVAHLRRAPDVLRALIRYGHDQLGIRPALTDETLAAVDEWEPEYQDAIRSPRPQGPMALLAAMGALDPDKAVDPDLLQQLADEYLDIEDDDIEDYDDGLFDERP